MKKLQIAYFGTPEFSACFLEKILTDKELPVEVKFVITQPDKPIGRKQTLTPTPVKEIANKYGIETYDGLFENLKFKIENCDLALLYAYGKIITPGMLSLPKYGFWNIHPSLLPKYRGPSPMAFPLIKGDKETGVTLMQMDEQMDHGPIIAQEKYEIKLTDKRPDLEKNLTDLGYELFKKTITNIQDLRSEIQDHSKATYTHLLTKNDGFIPFETLKSIMEYQSSNIENPKSNIQDLRSKIYNLFRGLYPWPGVWTKINLNNQEKRLKITDIEIKDSQLILKKVQLEGKNEVDFKTFNKAYKL